MWKSLTKGVMLVQSKKFVITYRLFFVLLCAYGIYLNIIDKSMESFMGNGTCLNFYTLQSNIWVFVLEIFLLVHLIIEVVRIKRCRADVCDVNDEKIAKQELTKENLIILKYIVTVAICLTFLVYWCMLAPYLGLKYLLTPSNVIVHGITPLLMLIDYFTFDRKIKLKKKAILLTLIPPIYYFAFALVRAEISTTRLTGGSRYPYWFIDVDMFGWFGNGNGLGIMYWVLLIIIFVLGIGKVLYRVRDELRSRKFN